MEVRPREKVKNQYRSTQPFDENSYLSEQIFGSNTGFSIQSWDRRRDLKETKLRKRNKA